MIDINDITIDHEFEACCPALSAEERTQLTANIIRDRGIRDPLVVWLGRGILVDGHNRYDIWRNACGADPDMAPEIIEKPFKDRADALAWIVRNQLGRRNLTDAQRVALALKLKPELQAQAKANQGTRTDLRQNPDECPEPMRVDDAIAKEAGTSRDTVRKVEAVLQSGDEQTASDMLAGKVSINQAAKKVNAGTDTNSDSCVDGGVTSKGSLKAAVIRESDRFLKSLRKVYEHAPAESHKVAASLHRRVAENLERGVYDIERDQLKILAVLDDFPADSPSGEFADDCRAFLKGLLDMQSDEKLPLAEEEFNRAALKFKESIKMIYGRFFGTATGGAE